MRVWNTGGTVLLLNGRANQRACRNPQQGGMKNLLTQHLFYVLRRKVWLLQDLGRHVRMPEKYKDYKLYQLNSDRSLDLR